MNILYISHLTNIKSEGPNNSVPAQVLSQSKFDNVFWWNLTDAIQKHWLQTGFFHGIKDFPHKRIMSLPSPFDKPDLVVFESFYYIDDVFLSLECRFRSIPYIIVPRSALTRQGQEKKRKKKLVANFLAFKSVVKHAAAIQYLTKREYNDSGTDWNNNYFIIPNGIKPCEEVLTQTKKQHEFIEGIYIGRFDPYQKGLDLLLDAIIQKKEVLRRKKIRIYLYGPERMTCRSDYQNDISRNNLDDILIVKDGVFDNEKDVVLRNADFFIMTSRFEGMPMSMVEAMSYGLPCFATEGTNMTDIIDKWCAGWCCETSVEGIMHGIDRMVDDLEKLKEIGNNAKMLSKVYNWDSIGKKTHSIYQKIISRSNNEK